MLKQWKWGKLFGLVTLFLFLLAACTQEKTAESPHESETPSANEGTSQDTKQGGTFTFALAADPDMLDPHRQSSIYTHQMAGLVYNKLVTYETGSDVAFTDYNIVPDLAESWDISDDGKEYTFHLREAYWHDIPPVSGRKVVSEDVVATMERIIDLPGHQAALLSEVEDIEAKDEETVVFTLKQPFAPFLNFMANHFMWILPQEVVDEEFDLATTAIGTGPFMLEQWEDNVQATFVRNPHFYEEGKPFLDKLVYKVVPDQGARIAAFRTGQADSIGLISPEEVDNLLETNPDTIINEEMMPTQVQVYMNMEREPFTDVRIRKAISMAVDRQNAVDRIFGGGEVSGPVNPSLGDWALPLEEREALQPYDPDKAKQLLAEAGYPDGFDTTVMVTDGYGEQTVRMAQWVVEDLRKIGINAEIEMVEYASYFSEKWPNKDYDIGIGFQTYFQEPDEWLRTQLHSEGTRNWYGINDPDLDKLLDEQRMIFDEEERREMVYDIQRYVLENVVNPIPLVTHYTESPQQPYVKNWEAHASYGIIHMKDVWLDQ